MGKTPATQPDNNPQKGHVTPRNYEVLPDCLWTHIAAHRLLLLDLVVYLFFRQIWRPRHWDPKSSEKKQIELCEFDPRATEALFGLSRGAFDRACARLSAALGRPAGNPYVKRFGSRGRGHLPTVELYSLYTRGALLDKHAPSELDPGHNDPVHHGFLLPFGSVHHGEVIRYFTGEPLLTLEAAGIFLWLLYLADCRAIREGFLEGEGFAKARQRVEKTRRDMEAALHITKSYRQEDFLLLERLGWIRPVVPTTPAEATVVATALDYLVAEAPAGLLELLMLALVTHQGQPMALATTLVDDIAQAKRGVIWVLNALEDMGLSLTPEGEERLRVEIAGYRQKALTFQPASPTAEAILDTIYSFTLGPAFTIEDRVYLERQVGKFIAAHGERRVWDVVWNARRLQRNISLSLVGWIRTALKAGPSDWPLQPAPAQGLNTADYADGGQYAHLFRDED